jgi:predicted ATPase
MAKIEGIRIKNFRSLKDVTLGRLWNQQKSEPLTPMTVVIGKNGVGKSTLFDVFGFLADALKVGVEEACDSRGRGGFKKIRSQGQSGAIEFEIYYKEDGNARPITYEIFINIDESGRPFVQKERLRQRRKNQTRGWPFSFLVLNDGKGVVWKGEGKNIDEDKKEFDLNDFLKSLVEEESKEIEIVELSDKRKLGIATLGSLKQHPRISAFRQFIEGWYLSYFEPNSARSLPLAGPQKHLNIKGDNIGNVVQFMEREHKARFQKVLDRIAKKIPGINKIDTDETADGRLLLRFNDKGFHDPFYAQQMSDGTLKVFAYLKIFGMN